MRSPTLITCSNCNNKVPKSLYCLKCGCPLYHQVEDGDGSTESKKTLDAVEQEEYSPVLRGPSASTITPNRFTAEQGYKKSSGEGKSEAAAGEPTGIGDSKAKNDEVEWIKLIRRARAGSRIKGGR